MVALRAGEGRVKRRTALFIALGVLVFAAASGVTLFYAYRTFTTTGEGAVQAMNAEERAALERLSAIERTMTVEQVHAALGAPSEDRYVLVTWNGFGGSPLSQARVYFLDEHPRKIRWIKLGYFVYEKDL